MPAILEFLAKNQDVSFGLDKGQVLGYGSARVALFDALRAIGGPEGIDGTLRTLRATGDPREILMLSRNLDAMAPGEHREEMLEAARQTIAMARRGELKDFDVGPVFEVMHLYGGVNALGDLEQGTGQWKYYSAIALANLPEGAGIPSLIRMAEGKSAGDRQLALEMLAQLSAQNPDARAAFLAQVRSDGISPRAWPYFAAVLGGDHYQFVDSVWNAVQNGLPVDRLKSAHIPSGNQNFYQGLPLAGLTPEQANQYVAVINEALAATSNPAAVQALQTARKTLNERLATVALHQRPP